MFECISRNNQVKLFIVFTIVVLVYITMRISDNYYLKSAHETLLPKVRQILLSDKRFKNLTAFASTRYPGDVCVEGELKNNNELIVLMKKINDVIPSEHVFYRIDLEEPEKEGKCDPYSSRLPSGAGLVQKADQEDSGENTTSTIDSTPSPSTGTMPIRTKRDDANE